ncbi:unnamed protein product [Sphagnum jensenii]|jgi:hypothetical protein|uniref:Uncharacterized protein n=1 Tax=Sphagnum jensenii TaxID=128206 RepID=A0ABP0W1P0_9BRYO
MQAAEKEKDGSSLRQQQQQSKLQLQSSVVPAVEEQEQDQEAGDSSNRRGAQSPDWEMVESLERPGNMASLMEVLESGSVARASEEIMQEVQVKAKATVDQEVAINRLEVCEGITEVDDPQERTSVDGAAATGSVQAEKKKKVLTALQDFHKEEEEEEEGGTTGSCKRLQERLLQEKVRFLEGELKIKCSELDSMKQMFQEREHEFLKKIECLQLANEQLLDGGGADSSVQLQMELSRLQRQNSTLSMRERELQFQISTQEMLNEQLKETRKPNAGDSSTEATMEEAAKSQLEARMSALEQELAEALEVNNMYKIQLHNAFAKQKNVHAAALHNAGNVEDVVKELLQLRQWTKAQENELQDLQDRFFLISVRLAESVAQREELLMKVKRIQHLKHPH